MPIDYLSGARAPPLNCLRDWKMQLGVLKRAFGYNIFRPAAPGEKERALSAACNLNRNGSLAAASTRIPHANWLLAEQSFHPVE